MDQLLRLSRRADFPLGAVAHDRQPRLGTMLLAEVRNAPDPDRALGALADLFDHIRGAARYAERLLEAPEKARGLIGLFGASESLAKTVIARPDLLDAVVAGGAGAPDGTEIPALVEAAVSVAQRTATADDDPLDSAIGALRRTQREVTLQIGLADMAGVITPGEVARRLSALAAASLAMCFQLAARESAERFGTLDGAGPLGNLSLFALGSLAAGEMGYGGDVDLIVLYDREGETSGGRRAGVTMAEYAARTAQRAIAFLSSPHAQGPGYPVDTRLRPSGSQGTLVVSLDAFVRYHSDEGPHPRSASWERQALIRCAPVAGDHAFIERAGRAIAQIAYERGGSDPEEVRRLRARMEQELGREQHGAIALKYGPGGLVDAEFAAQVLQMTHGRDPSVRSPTTRTALKTLRDAGHLDPLLAEALLSGEKLLRRALLALRFVAGRSVLVPGTANAATVARKLGFRDTGARTAEGALFDEIESSRRRIRDASTR